VQTAELDRVSLVDAPLDSRIDVATVQNGGVRKSVSFGSMMLDSRNRYFSEHSLHTGFDFTHDGVEARLRHQSSGITPDGVVQVSSEREVANWRIKSAQASARPRKSPGPDSPPQSAQARLEALKERNDLVEIGLFRERYGRVCDVRGCVMRLCSVCWLAQEGCTHVYIYVYERSTHHPPSIVHRGLRVSDQVQLSGRALSKGMQRRNTKKKPFSIENLETRLATTSEGYVSMCVRVCECEISHDHIVRMNMCVRVRADTAWAPSTSNARRSRVRPRPFSACSRRSTPRRVDWRPCRPLACPERGWPPPSLPMCTGECV
jgi:hypothetical protein